MIRSSATAAARNVGESLVISALGMVSPVGANAAQTFTSVRADLCRKSEHPELYVCLAEEEEFAVGEPVVASAISHLDTRLRERDRPSEWLGYLAGQALCELRRNARLSPADQLETGLFLSLPPVQGAWGGDLLDQFSYHFHNWAEQDPVSNERFERIGHSGALKLCEDAYLLLREGKIKHAVIGGVDSYLFPERLAGLDRDYRIWSERGQDGFCPGEAAAFFLIEPETRARARGVRPWAILKHLSSATCEIAPGKPNTGAILAEVLSGILSPDAPSPLVVCDLNGETSRMKEWGFALSRLGTALKTPLALEHPARCLGDIGAATGAALVALAVRYLHTKYRHKQSALVWTASDNGDRRALLLERPDAPSCSPLHP